MYAVFLSGGKQYKAIENQTIKIEKLNNKTGESIEFNTVLMISSSKYIKIGDPFIPGSIIKAYIKNHGRLKKIKIIKFNRRKHYKKQQGHRQYFTEIKIQSIHYNIPRDLNINGT